MGYVPPWSTNVWEETLRALLAGRDHVRFAECREAIPPESRKPTPEEFSRLLGGLGFGRYMRKGGAVWLRDSSLVPVWESIESRFARCVELQGPIPPGRTGLGRCHRWTGHPVGIQFLPRGRRIRPRVVAWFLAYGFFPEEYLVTNCENPTCVNVHHAFESPGHPSTHKARKKNASHREQRPTAKKWARERDGNACRVCGFSDALNVHHIRHAAKGGSDDLTNLITLCPNHHALAHLGKLSEATMRDLIGASVAA